MLGGVLLALDLVVLVLLLLAATDLARGARVGVTGTRRKARAASVSAPLGRQQLALALVLVRDTALDLVRWGGRWAYLVVAPAGTDDDAAPGGALVRRPVLALHLTLVVIVAWQAAARLPLRRWRWARAGQAGARPEGRAVLVPAPLGREGFARRRRVLVVGHATSYDVAALRVGGHAALEQIAPGQGVDGDVLPAWVDAEQLIVPSGVRAEAGPPAADAVGRERSDPDTVNDDFIGRRGLQVPYDDDERAIEPLVDTPHDDSHFAPRDGVCAPCRESMGNTHRADRRCLSGWKR